MLKLEKVMKPVKTPKTSVNTLKRYDQGFTLVEIVMVVIIIAILSSIALPRYNKVIEQVKVAEAKNMLGAIRESEMRYAEEYDDYTAAIGDLDVNVTSGKYFTFSSSASAHFNDGNDDLLCVAMRNNAVSCPSPTTGYSCRYWIGLSESGNFTCVAFGPCPTL